MATPLDELAILETQVVRQIQQLRDRLAEMPRPAEPSEAAALGLGSTRGWTRRVAVLVAAVAIALVINALKLAGSPERGLHHVVGPLVSSRAVGPELGTGTLYAVPSVEGLSAFQASAAILVAGLQMSEAIPIRGPLGVVVASRPAAGKMVRPGTRVTVWVGVSKERLRQEH